jgi:histidine triad (HIT) family protein
VLVIPKQHISSLNDLSPEHDAIVGELVRRAAAIAQERGISTGGFRAVFNTNRDAGQTVFHIHLHLIGGRALHWPPG